MKPHNRVLFSLAADFEAQRAYAQAVKCLAPITADGGELPAVVAQARLQLGSLLLSHFDNFHEAKAVLLAAEQGLRQTQGHHLLRVEVWDALARCHQKLGAVGAEADALAAGLKACRAGAASKDKDALARWAAYLHFRLAEYALTHEGPEAAGEALARMEPQAAEAAAAPAKGKGRGSAAAAAAAAGVQLSGVERVLHLLARATLHLCAGQHSEAGAAIEAANPLIEPAAGGDARLYAQLHAHYSLLLVCMVVLAGRVNDLQQDPSGNIHSLVKLRKLLADAGSEPWAYAWLPPPALAAIGNLLHASLLRSLGKAAPAAAYLAAAQEAVDTQLHALGFSLERDEASLGMQAIWEGRVYCHLRVLVAEQHVLASLVACKLAQAAEQLAALTALLARFPSLLRDFVPPLHMLLGHYAHSTGQYAAAAAHFRAALAADAPHLADAAALAAALAELHADRGPGGGRAAGELLEARGLGGLDHVLQLPVHDRTSALLVSAVRAQRGGDDATARVHLTKALKVVHGHLGNTQMVAQVLNVLGPIQAAKGDRTGAEQMLGSAATLSKAQGDLVCLVTSSRELLRVFAGAPDDSVRATKQAAYVERKAGELAAAVAAAEATPAHAALLAWRPPRAG